MSSEKAATAVRIFGVRFDNVNAMEANKKFISLLENDRLRTIYTDRKSVV